MKIELTTLEKQHVTRREWLRPWIFFHVFSWSSNMCFLMESVLKAVHLGSICSLHCCIPQPTLIFILWCLAANSHLYLITSGSHLTLFYFLFRAHCSNSFFICILYANHCGFTADPYQIIWQRYYRNHWPMHSLKDCALFLRYKHTKSSKSTLQGKELTQPNRISYFPSNMNKDTTKKVRVTILRFNSDSRNNIKDGTGKGFSSQSVMYNHHNWIAALHKHTRIQNDIPTRTNKQYSRLEISSTRSGSEVYKPFWHSLWVFHSFFLIW